MAGARRGVRTEQARTETSKRACLHVKPQSSRRRVILDITRTFKSGGRTQPCISTHTLTSPAQRPPARLSPLRQEPALTSVLLRALPFKRPAHSLTRRRVEDHQGGGPRGAIRPTVPGQSHHQPVGAQRQTVRQALLPQIPAACDRRAGGQAGRWAAHYAASGSTVLAERRKHGRRPLTQKQEPHLGPQLTAPPSAPPPPAWKWEPPALEAGPFPRQGIHRHAPQAMQPGGPRCGGPLTQQAARVEPKGVHLPRLPVCHKQQLAALVDHHAVRHPERRPPRRQAVLPTQAGGRVGRQAGMRWLLERVVLCGV